MPRGLATNVRRSRIPYNLAAGAVELNAEPGSYSISGAAATLLTGRVINAGAGAYIISGSAATLTHDFLMVASPGTYVLSGSAATLLATRLLNAGSGAYTITGFNAELIYTAGGVGYLGLYYRRAGRRR